MTVLICLCEGGLEWRPPGYTSGHVSVMPGAREAVELLANRYEVYGV